MIDLFAKKKCTIVATKDCHAVGHCSFTTNGGGFPPHCVQGTKGYDVCLYTEISCSSHSSRRILVRNWRPLEMLEPALLSDTRELRMVTSALVHSATPRLPVKNASEETSRRVSGVIATPLSLLIWARTLTLSLM